MYVHLTDQTLATGDGVVRVDGERTLHDLGPILATQLSELLGHDRFVVKPVIDLHERISVDAYEIPDRIREHLQLTYLRCYFPWCNLPATRADLDHIDPYDDTGPPDQTSTENLGPGCRLHHRLKTHGGWTLPPPARRRVRVDQPPRPPLPRRPHRHPPPRPPHRRRRGQRHRRGHRRRLTRRVVVSDHSAASRHRAGGPCRRANAPIPPPSTGPAPAEPRDASRLPPSQSRRRPLRPYIAGPAVSSVCHHRVERPPPNGPRRRAASKGPHRTAASNRPHRTAASNRPRRQSCEPRWADHARQAKQGWPVQYRQLIPGGRHRPAAQSYRPRCARPSYGPRCAYRVVPAARWADRVVRAALRQSRRAGRVLRAEAIEQAIGPSCGRPLDSWRAGGARCAGRMSR